MSQNRYEVTVEELLEHAEWLSGVARRLVADAAAADDAVQQTWLRAIERPPRRGGAVRGWLGRVLRNEVRQRARSEGARSRREVRTGREQASGRSSPPVLARAKLHRRLTDLVLALDEPYRETLLLRYFEGLEPAEIARRHGLPAGTVRSRVKRGLDRLRDELDAEYAGDRRAWALALIPLSIQKGAAAPGGLAGGVLIVSMKTKAVLAAACLLVLVGGTLYFTRGADRPADIPYDPPPQYLSDPGKKVASESVRPAPAPESQVPAPEAGIAAAVRIRFVDGAGKPIDGAEARRRVESGGGGPLAVRLLPEALFTGGDVKDYFRTLLHPPKAAVEDLDVEWTSDGAALPARTEPGRYRLLVLRPGLAPMMTGPVAVGAEPAPALEVALPGEPAVRRVKLLSAVNGAPVAGARVTPYFEYGDDQLFLPGRPRTADSGGNVDLPLLEKTVRGRGRAPTWWAETDELAVEIRPYQLEGAVATATLEVRMGRRGAVAGKAWNEKGEPAAGREVCWTRKGLTLRTAVDPDGTFRLGGVPTGSRERLFLVLSEEEMEVRTVEVPVQPGETTEVVLGTPPDAGPLGTVTGRITAAGHPLAGVYVVTDGKGDSRRFARSDKDGNYRLTGLPRETIRIRAYFGNPRVSDDFGAYPKEALTLGAGESRRLDFDVPGGAFRVTVLDAETGKPIPGAVAGASPENRELEGDRIPGYTYHPGWADRVGQGGRVLLPAMVPGAAHVVRAQADGYELVERKGEVPGTLDNPVELTIRLKKKP